MSERVPAQNKTSATPSQATPANSPLLRRPLTDEQSESVGSSSNISQELGGIQPKTIRRSLNWQNISVEAPNRGNGMSLPGGIQRQQEEQEGTPAIEHQVSAKKAETSTGELSNLTRATEGSLQPKVDRGRLNRRHISVEAPPRSGEASSQPIQRQQEEQQETPEIQAKLAADSAQKSALESSNSTISTSEPAQKPLIARAPFNGRNIPVEAPPRSATSSTYSGEIQRLETSEVKKQAESIGESVNVKEEVDKASSPEPSYLFRADDNYKIGDPVGLELDSEEATTADIQDPLDHVLNKESGQTSRYVSFSSAITIPGGGGPKKFTKKNKILKAAWEAVQQLASDGKIRIYTPEQVAEMIRNNPKKKISKQANNVKVAMEKNGEILVEGQIPGNFIVWAK